MLSLARLAPAQTNAAAPADTKPLPAMDYLIQQVVAHAVKDEDNNDNLFAMNYEYTRTRTWEYRNGSGTLTSREQKSSVENKPQRIANRTARTGVANRPVPAPVAAKDDSGSDTNSSIKGKAFKVKDYSIPNLVKRFQFTLVGRETINGRPSLVVDFKPASNNLPVNQFADNFINKAAGRVWIDEEDYAIAQAQVRLTKQVNVLGGLVGAVQKFNCDFTRARTPEGYWFARSMNWHLEGREVLINRIVDYHEQKLDEQKIMVTAAR